MPKPNPRRISRREARDLGVEISFLEGLVRRDPVYVDALELLADDYLDRGRVADGLRIDQKLLTLRPDDPLTHYNLACSLTLNRQYTQASAELLRALELGYRDFAYLSRDPDLKDLRAHASYRTVRTKVASLKKKARNQNSSVAP